MRRVRLTLVPIIALSIVLFSCGPESPFALAASLPRPEAPEILTVADLSAEVHSVHAPLGIPYGMPTSNDLVFRHSYTASTNDVTKFADWVAYTVTADLIGDPGDPPRNYRADPFLDDIETLEALPGMGDYEGAHETAGYDRGHLVPLRSFHGSPHLQEVNLFSVMAPQIDDLNRGPWKRLEDAVRRLVLDHDDVPEAYVFAGPYFDADADPMPDLPMADEEHQVPNGFWMIVYLESGAPDVCAFVMPQMLTDSPDVGQFVVNVDTIESLTGLDFFSPLEDKAEEEMESLLGLEWYVTW